MYKVYRAVSRAPDEYLGYVEEDGRVFRSKIGLDDRLGRVDLSSGQVHEDRLGPDREIGHVDPKTGKVYLRRFGPDEYVGSVDGDGRMYRHVSMGVDEYIGVIDPFVSYAHSAGAMLLLVLPAVESRTQGEAAGTEE
jgi:hypothetical protein